MDTFPLPGMGRPVVAVPAPGDGPGYWAGAPCGVLDSDGSFVVGYRVRNGHDGIDQTVIARSADGERLTTVATLDQTRFDAQWMQRPAIVRTEQGRWRLYVCCGTPQTKHWWIEVLEADDPAGLQTAEARPAFPGDERTAVKDPIVKLIDGRWHAWICCHPLDVPGAEDRMSSAYATSHDGLTWDWHGTVLTGRPGTWDARGARLTSVRRTRHGRGELVRTHRPGRVERRPGRTLHPARGLPRGRRPLPGRASAARGWLSHLVRGPAARREPRAAHRAHPTLTT
jgi:hypothetical protein